MAFLLIPGKSAWHHPNDLLKKMDGRIGGLEEKIDEHLDSLDEKMSDRIIGLNEKIDLNHLILIELITTNKTSCRCHGCENRPN